MLTVAMIPKSFGARRPIPVDDLKRHCDRYHAYDDALFSEEFKVRTVSRLSALLGLVLWRRPWRRTKNIVQLVRQAKHSSKGVFILQ
jgi:hypothetical protein